MRIEANVRVNLFKLRMLSCVILGGFFIAATNGFENKCGEYKNNPCEIFSYSDLKEIEKNADWKHYVLMNDIQAPTDPPEIFHPIGTYFSGSLDGRGHAIRDIVIEGTGRAGLFEWLTYTANICNLVLENATVTGKSEVGVLAGRMTEKVRIENVVIVNPNVTGTTAGGLVGSARADILRCHVLGGTVNLAPGSAGILGGLVGHLHRFVRGRIMYSSAENVQVEGTSSENRHNRCGGLVGLASRRTVIQDSFATGNVTCRSAGGLIGASEGAHISNSYAVSNLEAELKSGGLVGLNIGGGVKNSFAVSETIGVSSKSSCLVDEKSSTVKNSYCFRKGQVGVGSSIPGGVTVVESPNYFLNKANNPLSKWKRPWTFEEGKYPSINKLHVDSGGPYKGDVDQPLHLDWATASVANYLWEVNSKRCSFDDPRVLNPVLSCTGNAKLITRVCLTASIDNQESVRDCRRVSLAAAYTPPCSVSSCKKSSFPGGRRKKLEGCLASIQETLDGIYAYTESYSRLYDDVDLAEDLLVAEDTITLNRVELGRQALKDLWHKVGTKGRIGHISTKEQRKMELKINKCLLPGLRKIEADCCDLR